MNIKNPSPHGLVYCKTKDLNNLDNAPWGSTVKGHDCGDGWLQVGERYLPMMVQGSPVLLLTHRDGHRPEEQGSHAMRQTHPVEPTPKAAALSSTQHAVAHAALHASSASSTALASNGHVNTPLHQPSRQLQISILGSAGLPEKKGGCAGGQRYCVCKVLQSQSKLKPKPGSQTGPMWKTTRAIDSWPIGDTLEFSVYKKGCLGSSLQGSVRLPSERFFPNGLENAELQLTGKSKSTLTVSVVPQPAAVQKEKTHHSQTEAASEEDKCCPQPTAVHKEDKLCPQPKAAHGEETHSPQPKTADKDDKHCPQPKAAKKEDKHRSQPNAAQKEDKHCPPSKAAHKDEKVCPQLEASYEEDQGPPQPEATYKEYQHPPQPKAAHKEDNHCPQSKASHGN